MEQRKGSDQRRHDLTEQRIQRSLTNCWKEGVLSQVLLGAIDTYLVPFALFLGAASGQIGFLSAFPNLFSSISQFFAVRAVNVAGNRLRLLTFSLGLQFLFLVPIAFLPFISSGNKILILIALVTGFRALGSLMGPAWGSLISEYLPPNRRGDYFGWRSRIVGISGLAGMIFWGVFLNAWKNQATGFVILFAGCTVLRLVSLSYMARLSDLPLHRTPESDFTFWMFLRRFRESNFVKFVFFIAGVTFGTQLAAPYFSVYMMRDLHFSYLQYTVVSVASVVAGLLSFHLWGRHADEVGTARILKMTGLLIPFPPLLWAVTHNAIGLTIVEFASGFLWGGFNLCTANFVYDAVSPDKRIRCLGYFNLINGVAAFAGASTGAFLSERVPTMMGSPLVPVFLVSAALRLAANLFMSPHFHEVRETSKSPSNIQLFFSVVGLRPFLAQNAEFDTPVPAGGDIHFGNRDHPDRRQN